MTDLYRYYDADGRLLYIGISLNAVARATQHRADKHWWNDVARMTVEKIPGDRRHALEVERRAIRDEGPLHNVVHNGQFGRVFWMCVYHHHTVAAVLNFTVDWVPLCADCAAVSAGREITDGQVPRTDPFSVPTKSFDLGVSRIEWEYVLAERRIDMDWTTWDHLMHGALGRATPLGHGLSAAARVKYQQRLMLDAEWTVAS